MSYTSDDYEKEQRKLMLWCGAALGGWVLIAIWVGSRNKTRMETVAGVGAYFQDPMNIPISGLGSNYVRVR